MATTYWYGSAVAIPEVYTISITGAWATDDTLTFTINGKDLTLTAGTAVTIDDIGAAAVAMINGSAAVGTETRSAIGSEVGEFAQLTAAWVTADDDLTITGPATGRPIGTLTVSATTAGSGAAAVDNAGDPTTDGTGPQHWDNVDNWSLGAVPVNTNDVVFDHQSAASCLYALSNGSLSLASLTITSGFKYSLGLPEVNTDSSVYPYDEHQTTHLTLAAATIIDIDGSAGGSIRVDAGSSDTSATVRNSGRQEEANVPPVLLNINNASADLIVLGGDVGVCFVAGTAGALDTLTVSGRSTVTLGDTITLSGCDGRITTGRVYCSTNIDVVNVDGGEWEQLAGTITTASIAGGVLWDLSSGTFTTVNMTGGRYDHSRGVAKTITNFNVYTSCHVKDLAGTVTVTNGYDVYPPLRDVTFELAPRKTYTISSI